MSFPSLLKNGTLKVNKRSSDFYLFTFQFVYLFFASYTLFKENSI